MGRPSGDKKYWNEVIIIEKNKKWKCKHCQGSFSGGFSRIKAHLDKTQGKGISICSVYHNNEGVQHIITSSSIDPQEAINTLNPLQYSELSIIDLLYDDEPNATAEKRLTCEDHVSFSLEGLGKVGIKTSVHSPEQWVSSSNFPFNRVMRSSAIDENGKHFYDFANKNDSSVSEECLYKTENSEDLWNDSKLSIIDLLCDDESNVTAEKRLTCEDHVSFSLEGLGKVGIEMPIHSPEQWVRISYSYSLLQKNGRKSKLKKLNHVVDDIELDVDTMMQDIEVSPISSSDFPFNKVRQSSAIDGDDKHFYDFANKNGSSVSEEYFYRTENSEELWNGDSNSITERMTQALRYYKELTELNVLAQFWAPVRNGDQYVLTTSGQPFVLDPHSNGLHKYRMVSLMYIFSVDGENDGLLGLPGRVFRHKLLEWTPNVQYYSSKEYPRRDHAQNYNVRGTLALPVFEPSLQSCVGVLELIMTSQKINYAPEVDKICKALETVNLRSLDILDQPYTQIRDEGHQNAITEILEILTVVCETHNLPLAQTWIPCRPRSLLAQSGGVKKSCSSFDGGCMGKVYMSTTDIAFYVIDAHLWGFREACVEHHLQQSQGVAGKAFLSHSMCFCSNITQFCKTDYPLSHYALMFGLTSCFAICLQSSHTGNDDYVLEFFLPPRITDSHEQKILLGSILATMKQHFQSLEIASGVELEDGSIEIIEATVGRT